MASAKRHALPLMTADEFMNWDGGGHAGKLELVNGEVVAMSPASTAHGIIQANLAYLIGAHIRANRLPCKVGTELAMSPALRPKYNVRVPDVAVTCRPFQRAKLLADPVLIIEVLSASNRKETWASIEACATIPSVMEIMTVDSERVAIEVFTKDDAGIWPKEPAAVTTGGIATLKSLSATFAVADIYDGTDLA